MKLNITINGKEFTSLAHCLAHDQILAMAGTEGDATITYTSKNYSDTEPVDGQSSGKVLPTDPVWIEEGFIFTVTKKSKA